MVTLYDISEFFIVVFIFEFRYKDSTKTGNDGDKKVTGVIIDIGIKTTNIPMKAK